MHEEDEDTWQEDQMKMGNGALVTSANDLRRSDQYDHMNDKNFFRCLDSYNQLDDKNLPGCLDQYNWTTGGSASYLKRNSHNF